MMATANQSINQSTSLEARMLWVREPKEAVFNVSRRHPDVFLVVRVEKVLQGALSKCLEPYLKGDVVKMGNKVRKQMKEMCARIGKSFRFKTAQMAVNFR